MNTISLQAERAVGGIAEAGANVVWDAVLSESGGIGYDADTGVVTLQEPGRYEFHWWVATQAANAANGIVFTLTSSQGDTVIGNSPAKTGEVTGTAVLEIPSAPVSVTLKNESGGAVFYSAVVPAKAALTVVGDTAAVPSYGAFRHDPSEGGGYIEENTNIIFNQVIGEYA
ncbi:MAG: hypothetical protein LBH54_01880, partial [Clostridiales bacterium]|nr:hypothetical protein [Clostridiales bacterium]